MNLKKTITIDLAARGAVMQLGEGAVSGDSGSRALVFELMEEGTPWAVPEGVRASLTFRTEHGAMGEYDTMPDGTAAGKIDGNRVTVRLLDGMLAKAGNVWMALVLRDQSFARLSAFPIIMTVAQGLEDAGEIPQSYYLVKNLEEINAAFLEMRERVDQVDTEENRAASEEARRAAEEARAYADSIDMSLLLERIDGKADDVYVRDGMLYLSANGQQIGEGVELPQAGGLAFDGGYVDAENYLHLTQNGADIEGFTPFEIPAGSGGGDSGSRITVAMETSASVIAAESAEEVELAFTFTSVDAATGVATGSGTMQISVGGVVKKAGQIEQGRVSLNIRSFLNGGANAVVLTVTDAYGGRAVRNISVTLETLALQWSLGATAKTESTVTLHLTATGNYPKTVHLQVDGGDIEVFEVTTSGRRVTKTIPVQVHGGHIISAYATMEAAGTTMTSDVLSCACAWVTDEVLPAIACGDVADAADQFSTVQLVHRVVDPKNNPTAVQYLVNGTLFREGEIDQSEQVWTYRLSAAGETTLTILCGNIRHDEVIQVQELAAGVEEVTDGLALKIDPAAMATLEDWEENGYSFTLSDGFDQVNGGLTEDADGIRCIRITAGDRLTLNYPLFGADARANGLAAKLVYAVRDSSAKHCTAISCMNGGIGLEIQPNNVYLRGNQTECKLSVCEDEKTELDFNIQPDTDDGILYLWEKCSTFAYMKYAADESFSHMFSPGITFGCDDADVYLYLARFYTRDLTDAERLANYIADGADTDEILDRQSRNDIYDSTGSIDVDKCAARNPDCHHIIISAERMTKGKKDGVQASFRHIYKAGGPEHQWTANGTMFVQGTSSVEHAETAGPNLNIYYPDGITLADGTVVADGYAMNGRDKSIPVLELCYKKNIASEDHIVNRMSAEWYNRFQPSVRPERVADPLVRDCLDSAMCCVYFHNSGSSAVQVGPDLVPPGATVFFGLGNLVSNKDSVDAFAYHPIVIEVKNNTEPQVLFKSTDLSGDNWGNNYEFRYLDTAQYTEDEARAEWQKVQNFLYETDCTAATDEALAQSVTVGGTVYVRDSVEYRKARWDAEAPAIFDKKTLTWHHNITLFLLLRDNRAKNMFWSKDPVSGKWGLWFNWDNDTGLCRNNDGYIDIEPGYMDFDTLGTGDVFNGASNVVFNNLRTWDFEELKADYLDRESAGAWDIDGLYGYAMESQESVCEALWIEDAAHNAIRTMQNLGTTAYLERATGRLRLHLKKALTFQKVLVDSYYCSTAATGQSAAFRGYTPAQWAGVEPTGKISVTAYTSMYINIRAGATDYRVRAAEGVPVEVDISASLNNTEIYFRHAQWLQDLGDLAGLYLGQFEASMLRRVRRLSIGSDNAAYYNTNFTQASFDNCRKLEYLNLGGLRNAARSFDFRPNLYLKELYTRGSGVTGVTFAQNGRLQTARLNAVKSLDADSLTRLETFTMPTYENLNVLSVEDTPAMDTQAMAEGAQSLQRVRLIGVDWQCENADTLVRLAGCAGRDEEGRDIQEPTVTGKVHIAAAPQEDLDAIAAAFPELNVTCDAIVPSFTVRFLVDGVEVDSQRVAQGRAAADPVKSGRCDTPTRAATVETKYSYIGWDTSLLNITADTDISAVFAEEDRYYIVRYWYDAAETDMAQEFSVIAHGSCEFTAAEPEEEGRLWIGWDGETLDVVSDLNLHALMLTPTLPTEIPEKFDYLYSTDPEDVSACTAGEFYGILYYGRAREYFAIGDRIRVTVPKNDSFADLEFVLELRSFRHFESAEREGEFAGPYFGMVGVMNASQAIDKDVNSEGGYAATNTAAFLEDAVYPALPRFLRSMMELIQVPSVAGCGTAEIAVLNAHLTLESRAELGFNAGEVPYSTEVAEGADEVTFGCYTDNASRIKKTYNGAGSVSGYWLRTPNQIQASQWDYLGTGGGVAATYSNKLFGVSFGFCLRQNGGA